MGYSKRSVHKQLKKSGYKSVKMLITPQTADGAIQRCLQISNPVFHLES